MANDVKWVKWALGFWMSVAGGVVRREEKKILLSIYRRSRRAKSVWRQVARGQMVAKIFNVNGAAKSAAGSKKYLGDFA